MLEEMEAQSGAMCFEAGGRGHKPRRPRQPLGTGKGKMDVLPDSREGAHSC